MQFKLHTPFCSCVLQCGVVCKFGWKKNFVLWTFSAERSWKLWICIAVLFQKSLWMILSLLNVLYKSCFSLDNCSWPCAACTHAAAPPPCLILTTTSYAAKEDSWFPASTLLCKKTSSVICQSRPEMVVVHNASTGSIVLQKLLSSLVKCPWRSVASTDYFRNLCFLLS